MQRHGSAALALALAIALAHCGPAGRRPRDAPGRVTSVDAGVAPEASVAPPPTPLSPRRADGAGQKPRLLAHASCRALAIDEARVYYGSTDDDALYAVPKAGGDPVHLARRAPVAGALAIEGGQLAWIATPGDVVLRVAVGGGAPATLRERGIFADVAMQGGGVFVAEVVAGGGLLTRIGGAGASAAPTRIASFDVAPRAIAVDATHAYVATSARLLRAPRDRGDVQILTSGSGFDTPVLDDAFVYVAATTASGQRDVIRIPKEGGEARTVASDLRAAPIAIQGGELFYFDARRPRLMAVPTGGGEPRVVSSADAFTRPNAIVADSTAIYVATGEREDGAILAVDRGAR